MRVKRLSKKSTEQIVVQSMRRLGEPTYVERIVERKLLKSTMCTRAHCATIFIFSLSCVKQSDKCTRWNHWSREHHLFPTPVIIFIRCTFRCRFLRHTFTYFSLCHNYTRFSLSPSPSLWLFLIQLILTCSLLLFLVLVLPVLIPIFILEQSCLFLILGCTRTRFLHPWDQPDDLITCRWGWWKIDITRLCAQRLSPKN